MGIWLFFKNIKKAKRIGNTIRNRIIYLCFRILLLTLSTYFNGVNLLCRCQFFLFTFVSYWEMYYFLIEQDKSPRYWKRYLILFFIRFIVSYARRWCSTHKKHQRIFKSIKVFKTKFPVNNINSYDLIGDFKQSNRNKDTTISCCGV